MAALILPQEVSKHLEAAIQLSNRLVHLRFLEEADVLIGFNLPAAAIRVAGVVIESIVVGFRIEGTAGDRPQLEYWLELRNRVAHPLESGVTLGEAREMVEGVRRILTASVRVEPPATPAGIHLRGKYKGVPTSSEEFILKKADELRLEHDERRL